MILKNQYIIKSTQQDNSHIIGKSKEKAAVERDEQWTVSEDTHYKTKTTAGWGSEFE